ncbi:MAG TPA: thiamine phosphate synthase [Gemmatimonadaceae bacterium]|nr:thiamine phosphate synthase [Gemmatimonadaceae bacterium]
MATSLDYSVYLILDPLQVGEKDPVGVAEAAVEGGVRLVQLRCKGGGRAYLELAEKLRRRLERLGVPLIVNDRADVALASRAAGVHVGQDDLPAEAARALLGNEAVVGLSITKTEEARSAPCDVIDYAGVGPIFETPSKPDAAPAMGLDALAESCRLLRVPAVAIGGITVDRVTDVLRAGASGVAVISAICSAPDPGRAASELVDAVAAARRLLSGSTAG